MHNNRRHASSRNDGAKDHQRKVLAQMGPQRRFRDCGEERVDHDKTKLMLN
jgi:hypothetical protein